MFEEKFLPYHQRHVNRALEQRLFVTNNYYDLHGHLCSVQWRTQEFCSGGGRFQQIQLRKEDRERGSGGGSPLVTGSGGSCNFVQEISFHVVKVS